MPRKTGSRKTILPEASQSGRLFYIIYRIRSVLTPARASSCSRVLPDCRERKPTASSRFRARIDCEGREEFPGHGGSLPCIPERYRYNVIRKIYFRFSLQLNCHGS